jgi:glutamyl-tRNA synthetase
MLRNEIEKSDFKNNNYSNEYLLKIISAMKERVSFVKEYLTKSSYFFEAPKEYEQKNLQKRWKESATGGSAELLKKYRDNLLKLSNPAKEEFEKILEQTAAELNTGKGNIIHPLRIAVSGVGEGPGVFDILNIIGKDETISRINTALEKLSK